MAVQITANFQMEEVHLTSLNFLGSLSFHPNPKNRIFFLLHLFKPVTFAP